VKDHALCNARCYADSEHPCCRYAGLTHACSAVMPKLNRFYMAQEGTNRVISVEAWRSRAPPQAAEVSGPLPDLRRRLLLTWKHLISDWIDLVERAVPRAGPGKRALSGDAEGMRASRKPRRSGSLRSFPPAT